MLGQTLEHAKGTAAHYYCSSGLPKGIRSITTDPTLRSSVLERRQQDLRFGKLEPRAVMHGCTCANDRPGGLVFNCNIM
jgi:hypothetical protein